MIKYYPYLKDSDFIYEIDTERLQNQFIKITLLDWKENPLQEIQGIATGGSISLNGSSAVRRTCSLSMSVKDVSDGAISDTKNLISINKKIFLEVGIVNKTNKYKEYPIIWQPQGIYVINSCSVSTDLNGGTNLTAQFKDKMCLLNGECGGVIPSSVRFDEYETIDENGAIVISKPNITQIIRELVNHWGGEQLGKIIISDIDEKIKKVMKWNNSTPLYLVNDGGNYSFVTNLNEIPEEAGYQTFNLDDDIGFVYTDFVWPTAWGELSNNAGDNVCTILDKIKNSLGNYEYYYDVFGNFIFEEIKNYLNTTQSTIIINNMNNNNYKVDMAKGKSVYSFIDNKLAISFSNTPQYSRIKNDFIVWGIRENSSGVKVPIRYHLAIDKKPKIGNIYEVFFYKDPKDGLIKAKCPIKFDNKSDFPATGVAGLYYMDLNTGTIYIWNTDIKDYVSISGDNIESYASKSVFPETGEKDVIYIDLSDNNKYIWGLDPESNHYNIVQLSIDELKEEYQTAVAALQYQIDDIIDIDLALVNREIAEVTAEMAPYKRRKDYLSNLLSSKQLELEYREIELEGYQERKINAQSNITNLNQEISNLEARIAIETDPTEKAILEAVKSQKEYELAQEELEVEKLDDLIVKVNEDISNLNDAIEDYEDEIEELEETLAPYESQLAELNLEKEGIEEQIAALQSQIDDLTLEFNINLNTLLDSQYEYVLSNYDFNLVKVKTTDWRSELYLQGASAEPLGIDSNYYYPELDAEWPKLYDLRQDHYTENGEIIYTGGFLPEVIASPWKIDYMLDFIDGGSAISALNIDNIGRRSKVESQDTYNCVFEPQVPDFIIIENNQVDTESIRRDCEKRNQPYIQVNSNIYSNIVSGGTHNSCFEEIKNLLYSYTNYNSSISISAIPIYHLEPNTRITVQNKESDIFGDFMITNISIPLTISGNMTISATQVENKL